MRIPSSAAAAAVAAVLVALVALSGCSAAPDDDVPTPPDDGVAGEAPPNDPADDPDTGAGPGEGPPPEGSPTHDWDDLDFELALSDGWQLRDCDGDAPLRCLHGPDGTLAGTVELLRFPGHDRLADVEDAGGARAALDVILDDFHAWLVEDRAVGCPGHRVRLDPTLTIDVAGAPAAIRSHALEDADGRVAERSLAAYIVDGGDLVIINVAATAPGSCTDARELVELEPDQLETLRADLIEVIARGTIPSG